MTLSTRAQAILAGHWMNGIGDNCVVTFGNELSRLTKQSRDAMSELMMAGIIIAEKADDNRAESISYRLTEKGKKMKRSKSLDWMEKHGNFSLTEPIR